MIINLLYIQQNLVNVFLVKYHHIHNILYGCKGLLGPSKVKLDCLVCYSKTLGTCVPITFLLPWKCSLQGRVHMLCFMAFESTGIIIIEF